MAKKTVADIEKIRGRVDRVKRLSDRVVGVGPFGVGLDGVMAWVPVAGPVYSVGAAAYLFWNAFETKAPPQTLARMAGYLLLDSASSSIWGLGSAVDFFFPGHLMAGKALLKHVDDVHWVEDEEARARATGDHDRHLETMRANGRKRLVYLGRTESEVSERPADAQGVTPSLPAPRADR